MVLSPNPWRRSRDRTVDEQACGGRVGASRRCTPASRRARRRRRCAAGRRSGRVRRRRAASRRLESVVHAGRPARSRCRRGCARRSAARPSVAVVEVPAQLGAVPAARDDRLALEGVDVDPRLDGERAGGVERGVVGHGDHVVDAVELDRHVGGAGRRRGRRGVHLVRCWSTRCPSRRRRARCSSRSCSSVKARVGVAGRRASESTTLVPERTCGRRAVDPAVGEVGVGGVDPRQARRCRRCPGRCGHDRGRCAAAGWCREAARWAWR